MPIPEHVNPGDPRPSAAQHNETLDIAYRDIVGGGGSSDEHGHTIDPVYDEPMQVWELTGPMVYNSDWHEFTAPAKPVQLFQFADSTDPLYQMNTNHPGATLFLPSALHAQFHTIGVTTAGEAAGIISFTTGNRVYVQREGPHLWILSPPLTIWRFELKTALVPGGTATAYLLPDSGGLAVDTGVEFTVSDTANKNRGRPRIVSGSTYNGSRGLAKYMPDSNVWEILTLEQFAPLIYFRLSDGSPTGALTGRANTGAYIINEFGGLDPSPVTHELDVYNTEASAAGQGNDGYLFNGPLEGDLNDGYRGLAIHDIYTDDPLDSTYGYGKYRVIAMEPNTDGWNDWEVVTAVNFGGSTVTTETIQVPDWNIPV